MASKKSLSWWCVTRCVKWPYFLWYLVLMFWVIMCLRRRDSLVTLDPFTLSGRPLSMCLLSLAVVVVVPHFHCYLPVRVFFPSFLARGFSGLCWVSYLWSVSLLEARQLGFKHKLESFSWRQIHFPSLLTANSSLPKARVASVFVFALTNPLPHLDSLM